MTTAEEILMRCTSPGELFEKLAAGTVRCLACGHRCKIQEGKPGICKVRFNRDGILQVPFGYVSGLQCDPVEKKPFFHVRPGAAALSFGMLGCNFQCGFCQNWMTSQVMRETGSVPYLTKVNPEDIVRAATENGADLVVSTYNEPLITSEWAVAVFKEAKAAGLVTAYVSNGFGSPESLEFLDPWVDVFNVDLKCFNGSSYRKLGGALDTVLDTIRNLVRRRKWIEIITLLIPGFNDSEEELKALADFIHTLSPDIPWHVTAFHRDYRWIHSRDTSPEDLLRAVEIGKRKGLRYIYAGNLPGNTGNMENTRCPNCNASVVERIGFRILRSKITSKGMCDSCSHPIPGIW